MIENEYIVMPNDQLFDTILHIVKPTHEIDWVNEFVNMVTFTKFPVGYVYDILSWSDMYHALLKYIYLTGEVSKFLNVCSDEFQPPLMSEKSSGKIGLIELFYTGIPNNYGINIHQALLSSQVKACRSIDAYLILFQGMNQKLMEDSKTAQLNKKRMDLGSMSQFNSLRAGMNSNNNNKSDNIIKSPSHYQRTDNVKMNNNKMPFNNNNHFVDPYKTPNSYKDQQSLNTHHNLYNIYDNLPDQ